MKRCFPGPRAIAAVLALLLLPLPAGPAWAGPEGRAGEPDRELRKAIEEAIRKGAEYLRSKQKMNGKIGEVKHSGRPHYEIGTTALAGLALLAAGDRRCVRKKNESEAEWEARKAHVDKAMDFCRTKDQLAASGGSRTTYDTGVLLMFVVEYYHPHLDKKGRVLKHTVTQKERDNPCKLPEDIAKWIRDMAQFLIDAREESDTLWGYPKPRSDMSNTQYALLGLRAARDCGGKVPGRVFKKVIEKMLETQEKDGPKVMRTLGGEKKGEHTYAIDQGDRARGWSYLPSPFMATGSMTTAGIACLAISHDALTKPGRSPLYSSKLERQVRRAIQDGFAWLDVNFTVKNNPPSSAPAWHFYYLYGLERAAMLAGRVLIGEHDWYIQGARYLVAKQRGDGSWHTGMLGGAEYESSDLIDTAWAILFLRKATKPIDPIPGPVITK